MTPGIPIDSLTQRLNDALGALFTSDQGKQTLKLLEEVYLTAPTCPPGATKGYGYFREGQNDLIRYIRRQVKRAQERTS
jgi:hypothetical protein